MVLRTTFSVSKYLSLFYYKLALKQRQVFRKRRDYFTSPTTTVSIYILASATRQDGRGNGQAEDAASGTYVRQDTRTSWSFRWYVPHMHVWSTRIGHAFHLPFSACVRTRESRQKCVAMLELNWLNGTLSQIWQNMDVPNLKKRINTCNILTRI